MSTDKKAKIFDTNFPEVKHWLYYEANYEELSEIARIAYGRKKEVEHHGHQNEKVIH